MATILIVDDRQINRQFLVTLLGYGGYTLLEAADGAEALKIARNWRPDLIITDILMPTMDGYEFVRQLHTDPNFVNIPIIFYTATYREREARSLAKAAGVQYVLAKSADPQVILDMVNTALGHLPAPGQPSDIITKPPLDPLQVVSTKLTAKMGELHDLGSRLEALVELVLKLGSEHEPGRLLEIACDAARVIIGAEYAAIGMLDEDGQTLKHFVTSGLDPETIARIGSPPTGKGVLGKLLGEGQPLRLQDISADPDAVGFPPGHPPMRSFLGVPLVSPTGLYGRLYLTEKIGASEFGEEDQRVAVALGTQTAVAYENAYRYDEIQRHAANLQLEVTERRKAEEALKEKERLLSDAQRIGHIGSWNYDIVKDSLQYSDEMYRLLDVSPQEFPHNRAGFLNLIYAADRHETTKWMDLITAGRQVKDLDFRVFRGDGELRYLQSRGAVVFDTAGNPMRFIGTIQDITERKLAEIQIHQQIEHLNALHRIDLAIISSFNLRSTLETVLSQVIAELQVDAAAVLLLNPAKQTLEIAARQGFRTRAPETALIPIVESHAGRVARERRLIKIENLKDQPNDPLLTAVLAGEDFVCYYGVPLIAKKEVQGVLEVFHRVPLQPYPEWMDFLNTLAGQAAIAIENATLFENLQDSNRELSQAYDATIEGWSRALDLRDKETEGHTLRVTEMTMTLARKFGFSEEELLHIRWGALLHDIGKMGVPDHILLKPNQLTEAEQIIMQRHPQYAYDLLKPIAFLQSALDIPYCHHEKWDGTGYPRGLKGEEIPMAARLFSVVDVWDALTSDRPYRPAESREQALTYIREQSGKHFDPKAVELFFNVIEET